MKIKSTWVVVFVVFFVANNLWAKERLDSLMSVFKSEISDKEKGLVLNLIANEYLDINLEKSREFAREALIIGSQLHQQDITSDAYINIGNYYNIKGMLDSNLYYYQKSYETCLIIGDKNKLGAALNRLGLVYQAKSQYNKAMEYFLEAITFYKQAKNQDGLANVYNGLAIINDYLGNKKKALDYYDMALEMHYLTKDSIGIGSVLNNIGELYYEKNNLDSAFMYLNQAMEIFYTIRELPSLAVLYNNLGAFYLQQGKTDTALAMHNKALELQFKLDNKHGIANSYQEISHIYSSKKDYATARKYLEKALKMRDYVGNLQAKYGTLLDLSEVCAKQNEYHTALDYHKSYIKLKDSVLGEEMQTKVNELQERFASAEKDKQILLLEKSAEEKQRQTLILIVSLGIVLIIALILVYAFRTKSKLLKQNRLLNRQQKELTRLSMEKTNAENELLKQEVQRQQDINKWAEEKFNAELEYKNRELITLTMHIQNKNKALGEVRKSLEEMNSGEQENLKKGAKKIIREINHNINLDQDWEQFKMHFDKVNIGFFDKLQHEFGELTKNDLKLCAYLKINLSSKEIAQILNISIAGVNKSRNRLRKKMNLTPDINLTSFILSY